MSNINDIKVQVKVDANELDVAIEKVERLVTAMKEAKSLADDLAYTVSNKSLSADVKL